MPIMKSTHSIHFLHSNTHKGGLSLTELTPHYPQHKTQLKNTYLDHKEQQQPRIEGSTTTSADT